MSTGRVCFCAGGCGRNPMADPDAFGWDCDCLCHADDPFDGRACPTCGQPLRRMEPIGPCRHRRTEVPA